MYPPSLPDYIYKYKDMLTTKNSVYYFMEISLVALKMELYFTLGLTLGRKAHCFDRSRLHCFDYDLGKKKRDEHKTKKKQNILLLFPKIKPRE